VASDNSNRLLDQLDQSVHSFAARDVAIAEKLLVRLRSHNFKDAQSLIRFHEILLFLRAYPPSARVAKAADSLLATFAHRVEGLNKAGVDTSPLDHPDVSGIAGTSVIDIFTYNIVRWLLERHPTQIAFYWEWFEDENRLAETWPRFMPLLEEDAFVEANVPYIRWLSAARDGKREIAWLIEQFARLPLPDRGKAELYDSQKLYVRWKPSYRATRTGMRLPAREIFYHRGPLIQRREIMLRDELEKSAPPFERLSPIQGRRILDMAREASTVRYRELYGFTHGDNKRVLSVHLGRGVDLFVVGVPPERRLPLRAYHAAMIFKNGVPVGYFEGLSLFERMESGFNLYYTFRDGETAWIYARTLNVLRHLLQVTTFSLDPYQIGHENEEGIESGAFWFYRKLGFRPTNSDRLRLTESEERKITSRRRYRTPARVLRQLAMGPMIFELDESKARDWDRFSIRNIGFAVQRCMAEEYGGAADKLRLESVRSISALLAIHAAQWSEVEMRALTDLAVALNLIPELHGWTNNEKESLVRIIRAKAGIDESRYLKLLQQHPRLRNALIKLGE
jgi:hypothetical protein